MDPDICLLWALCMLLRSSGLWQRFVSVTCLGIAMNCLVASFYWKFNLLERTFDVTGDFRFDVYLFC